MKKFALLLVICCSMTLSANGTKDLPTSESGPIEGLITHMEGDVLVDGQPAELGMTVPAMAVVETGLASYCEIQFLGQNIFRLEEDTLMQLQLNSSSSSLTLERGGMAALFEKLDRLTGDSDLEVRTPTTTAGIRGTAFYIKVENPQSTYLCACNGSVSTRSADGSVEELLQAAQHQAVRFALENGEISIESAGLEYHDNSDMDSLARSIKTYINWDSYNR